MCRNKIKYYRKEKSVILYQCENNIEHTLCVFVNSVVENKESFFEIVKDKKTYITSLFKNDWSIELYD